MRLSNHATRRAHLSAQLFGHPLPAWLLVACALVLWAPWSEAQDAAVDAAAPRRHHELPPLPEVPKLALAKPEKEDLEDLDLLLSHFRSADPHVRETAVREILEVPRRLVPAIDNRMDAIADKADRDEMKKTLSSIRKKARSDVREQMKAEGKRGRVKTPDYLEMLAKYARPQSKAWQDLIAVVAMSRMLTQIGTVQAVRELIDVYVRFGEFLRVDTQLQLEKLDDKAVAALVEARRHKAQKIARWAERQLDMLGKAIPSETVQTEDQQVLADVLRAYGRVRDPDAARIVISFANSERSQIREAARQAVALMGEVAAWQLRDSYETIVGKKPPREWTWERTARELFGELDRMRLAQVYKLYDEGLSAHENGQLEAMRAAFDKVLARSPMFEHRAKMAPGYFDYAKKIAEEQPDLALDALHRAGRITDDDALKKRIQSLELTLQAMELQKKGVADQVLVRRALDLDGENTLAKDVLGRMERGELAKKSELNRYGAAGAIGGIALLAIAFIALFRRGKPEPAELGGDGTEKSAELGGDGTEEPAAEEPEAEAPAQSDQDDEPAASALDPQPAENDAEAHDEDDEPAASAPDPQPAENDAEAPDEDDEPAASAPDPQPAENDAEAPDEDDAPPKSQ